MWFHSSNDKYCDNLIKRSLQFQTKTAPCSFQWNYIEAHKWVLGSKMLKAMNRGIVPSLALPVTKHCDQNETNIILRDTFGLVANTPAIR